MVLDLIWAPDFFVPKKFGPREFWALRNLVPEKFGAKKIREPNDIGDHFTYL